MTGRPSDYSVELAADICARMSGGESLRAICMSDGMPVLSTVYLWLAKHKDFSENYATAQRERATAMFEEIFEIGDEVDADPSAIAKAKLRVDTRKWALARMDSKRYGDKMTNEVTGADGGPLVVVSGVPRANANG